MPTSCALNFLLLLLALCASTLASNSEKKKKKILSFGGNGMIGAETLSRLIKMDDEQYDITLVSRGSWPFDSAERIKPHVRHVTCNRKKGLAECDDLTKDISQTEEYFAVLDFSGYRPKWIKEAVEALEGKARVYIYVSTDSVYEVTEIGDYGETRRKILETDAVRPEDEHMRKELNKNDSYGDRKFEGEEVLVDQRGGGGKGFPYVFLRFADVIGPRDGTSRFQTYFMWLKYAGLNNVPSIHVPKSIPESTSITYSVDAAYSIINSMHNPDSWDEAYNIACDEIFNITSAFMTGGHLMGKHFIKPKKVKSANAYKIYPSVTRGPIDIAKAREKLGFEPTELGIVLRKSIDWYEKMYRKDKSFRKECIAELVDVVDSQNDYTDEEERKEIIESLISEVDMRDEL